MGSRARAEKETLGAKKDGARIVLVASRPGLVRALPALGTIVRAGEIVGELEVLGTIRSLVAPPGAHGAVVQAAGEGHAKAAVAHGTTVLVLDPALGVREAEGEGEASEDETAGLVFKTPLGGRYYARPGPDSEPFVRAGDVVESGATVALVEVMKTFHRVRYGGDGMPARAKIVRILPADGDDVGRAQPLFEIEPA